MGLTQISVFLRQNVAEWRNVRVAELLFTHRNAARFAVVLLIAVTLGVLILRVVFARRGGTRQVALPAILPMFRHSPFSFVRHGALLLFLCGLPFFLLAFADPFTSLTQQEVSFPGRRIGLLIDASSSMMEPFKAQQLGAKAPSDARFFTAVAAAETFVKMRMKSKYRDLISLIEFGDESYVITPFTNDYDNILLSIGLIGDPVEYSLFPDQGTIIAQAIDQSIGLFKAFNFLDASGNLMVIFTDGEDTRAIINGRTLDEIVQATIDAKIPLYFVRTNYERERGKVIPDELWIPAVEKTGGRFYAADSEESLLNAIRDIDEVSAGTIQTTQYSTQRPRFALFAMIADACWTGSAAHQLAVPQIQKLP